MARADHSEGVIEMKQYLLSVHYVDGVGATPAEEAEESYAATGKFNDEVKASGNWVFAGGLFPPDTATVVRNAKSEMLVTDGPFSEAKEQLGGFWVLAANDLDEAIALAARASAACRAPVEVRPFHDGTEG